MRIPILEVGATPLVIYVFDTPDDLWSSTPPGFARFPELHSTKHRLEDSSGGLRNWVVQ